MDQFLEFTANHTLMVVALFVSFFVLVFSELRRKANEVSAVDAASAVQLINSDAAVVDLRSADAFSRGHIVNARNVPFDEFEGRMETLSKYKTKPLVVVCDAGITSNRAVDMLAKAGFESAYSLKGGMTGWQRDGLPIVGAKKTGKKK